MAATNPFRFSGPLPPAEMIDRETEAGDLLDLVEGGHSLRLLGPRRYGKTTLLRRLLDDADRLGHATCLVDLEDVLSVGEIVVRIERAYARRLKGKVRAAVDTLFRSWNLGLSLSAGGFGATLQRNPQTNAEAVLLRLLELPSELHERSGQRTVVVFDEIQDVLAVPGADGKIRSVIQHHLDVASYAFAGSAPRAMEQLFADPKRPLLEQAVPRDLAPLPLDDVADRILRDFKRTGKDVGRALDPLIEFTRGHPMRSMMLAHLVWSRTPAGEAAGEEQWVEAIDEALAHAQGAMRAIWKALPVNERRASLSLALLGSPHVAAHAAAVGIRPTSVQSALQGLRDRADVVREGDRWRLTDPLFERWLQQRGILPGDAGDD
jgi:hypothetical protein